MKVHPARFGPWSEQKTSRSLADIAGDCLENYSNNTSEINFNQDTI